MLVSLQSTQLILHSCVLPHIHTDGAATIFPNSYAATGNQTRVGSLAPPQWTLILDALLTELLQLRQTQSKFRTAVYQEKGPFNPREKKHLDVAGIKPM